MLQNFCQFTGIICRLLLAERFWIKGSVPAGRNLRLPHGKALFKHRHLRLLLVKQSYILIAEMPAATRKPARRTGTQPMLNGGGLFRGLSFCFLGFDGESLHLAASGCESVVNSGAQADAAASLALMQKMEELILAVSVEQTVKRLLALISYFSLVRLGARRPIS